MSLVKLALLFLAAYCLTTFFVLAQTIPAGSASSLTGRMQTTDGQPLAYVSIGIPGTSIGTVSNELGNFTLILKTATAPTDSMRFSLLGYAPLTLSVTALRQQLVNSPVLSLIETAQQLAEVRITPGKSKTKGSSRIDTQMKTNLLISGQPSQNLGSEVGRRFNLPGKPRLLTEYQAYVRSNFESVTLRINIYEARSMQPLLGRNVYVTLPAKQDGWITIDLTPYNIVATGDVIASVQWVGSEGKGSYVALPIQMPTFATHYYKYGSQNKWKTFSGMSTPMTLAFSPVEQNTNPVPESLTFAR